MKILLTGKNGQVGFELEKKLSILGEVIATDRKELDIAKPDVIERFVDHVQPDIIINPAAYTAVDKAESEQELCYKINSIGAGILALKASQLNIPLIHFSTDYVFDGLKKEPYLESDLTNPQSIYGKSKCEGEEKVRNHSKHIILRTSWVFGKHGSNFLKTILRLIQEKESLTIVADQKGSPTSSTILADVTFKIVNTFLTKNDFNYYGTYHVANDGETNWHEYAKFITAEAVQLGLKVKCKPDQIYSINTCDYPTAAKRPLNAKLNTDKLKKPS